MSDPGQAEQILLEQVRQGSPEAWRQLVERYQGRLAAFARNKGIGAADADDLVQETFLQFIRGLADYRAEASIETWLFMIVRRRIIDHFRGRRTGDCAGREGPDEPIDAVPAPDLTASSYARRDEQIERERTALADALALMIDALKEQENFRDLKVIELVFHAQKRNRDIAGCIGIDENHVALIKHRWLKQLRHLVAERLKDADTAALESEAGQSLLTEIWEDLRPSCPKRSTVGGYLLGTLDAAWQDYLEFHLKTVGCRSCQANLSDLQAQQAEAPMALRERIMESTVGFLQRR
jgi:RNA polymerase sigma factor (sigma-70 family)